MGLIFFTIQRHTFQLFLSIFEEMKKLLLLTLLLPIQLLSQYVKTPTHFDSEGTSKHIIKGHVKMFLKDTVVYTVEKKNERFVTSWLPPSQVENKLNKVFDLGKLEYVSRTNGGYIFSIAVIDKTDDTKVINYCKFHVDRITQKIEEVEILIGE